jgi:hydrogenase maturation protease
MAGGMVIALGNADRGDDGLGPAVLACLRTDRPAGVTLHRAGDDALGLLDEWAGVPWAIAVDAVVTGAAAGTVHRMETADGAMPAGLAGVSSHGFGLAEAVALGCALGRLPPRLIVHAVEGAQFDTGTRLSPAVASAVETVAAAVRREVATLTAEAAASDA